MRTTISGLQLYSILDREFRELKSSNCKTCRMPLPFYRTPPDDVSANWSVGTPPPCPGGCHLVIAELVTRMWTKYDLEPERPQ